MQNDSFKAVTQTLKEADFDVTAHSTAAKQAKLGISIAISVESLSTLIKNVSTSLDKARETTYISDDMKVIMKTLVTDFECMRDKAENFSITTPCPMTKSVNQ